MSLDFDAQVAWPIYDWMGVAKAALEAVTRYLARDLGPKQIRVNTVSAGPLKTMAGKGIPGFDQISEAWGRRAPLGWDLDRSHPGRQRGGVPVVRHGRRASPAKSCTWTAGSTPWGPTWRSDRRC